ncbi:hypothetical protein Scep_005182 [Stephania cephalantha]|uniref:Uncharacterized protein n=1 Tax=Stephania cephalantha TaxID=152367 RepID=A0AAP0KTT6_9MAGN
MLAVGDTETVVPGIRTPARSSQTAAPAGSAARGSGGGAAAVTAPAAASARAAAEARDGDAGNGVEQRRGGALPDRLIPDEAQQQWTRSRDFDEARRRDGGERRRSWDLGCYSRVSGAHIEA